MKIRSIFSFAVLICFFLPWLDLFLIKMNGFEIPLFVLKATGYGAKAGGSEMLFVLFSYSMFLIPIFAGINIYRAFKNRQQLCMINEFHMALLSAVVILASISGSAGENFSVTMFLSFGFYLSVLFSVFGLIPFQKEVIAEETDEHAEIMAYFEKINDLKERGAISEEIYLAEKQRTEERMNDYNASVQEAYDRLFNGDKKRKKKKMITWIIIVIAAILLVLYFSMNDSSGSGILERGM